MDSRIKERKIIFFIIFISVVAPILLVTLLYLPKGFNIIEVQEKGAFPLFHAALNFCTVLLLILGYFFMRIREFKWHRNTMILAFIFSLVFVVSYVISKTGHEPVSYGGEGFLKMIYYFILITHIVLSGIIIPLVLFTLYRGLMGEYEKHKKIARWTWPIWLYVATSGVLVYVFMAPYY